jgi:hypothetical protein
VSRHGSPHSGSVTGRCSAIGGQRRQDRLAQDHQPQTRQHVPRRRALGAIIGVINIKQARDLLACIAQILERTPTRLPENAGDGRSRDRASLA